MTPEGKVIYIDPYAGTDDDYALPADLILVTHDHFDHCAIERVANRADGCVAITHNEAIVDGRHPTFDLERFDHEAAAQFAAPNAMVVYPGEDLEL